MNKKRRIKRKRLVGPTILQARSCHTYLERKGTALSKFRMNQASVLEAGLNDTRGGGCDFPPRNKLRWRLAPAPSRCANDEATSRGSMLSEEFSYSLCPCHVNSSLERELFVASSRPLRGSELSDFAVFGVSVWSNLIVPAVPVGAAFSSHPSGRVDVWTTYRRFLTWGGNSRRT